MLQVYLLIFKSVFIFLFYSSKTRTSSFYCCTNIFNWSYILEHSVIVQSYMTYIGLGYNGFGRRGYLEIILIEQKKNEGTDHTVLLQRSIYVARLLRNELTHDVFYSLHLVLVIHY